MSLERRILTDCLKLYRDFPCLWDNRLFLYSNKEARDQAYEVLLEKYRQLQEDATLVDLKRKIENMRTSYRRERKKVFLSRMKNDPIEYSPQLWYYNMMSFLDEVMDFSHLELQALENGDVNDATLKIEFDDETSSSSKRVLQTSQPRVKKRKTSSSAIYLEDQNYSDDNVDHEVVEEIQIAQINEQNTHNVESRHSVSEAEAFGTTVGLQLKELDLIQKIHAEKLISDVIYNARLGRLAFNSSLNIE